MKPQLITGIGDINFGKQYRQGNRIYSAWHIAMALGVSIGNTGGYTYLYITEEYMKLKIRKLTPLECFRLMNFTDEDHRKAEAINSNTQLYKQAGNSIVVNCLTAIFGQMIPGKENIYKEVQ